MKKLVLAALVLAPVAAWAAVTVQYSNHDGQKYEWSAVCSGSHTKAVFDANTTGAYTIQGSGPCTVSTPGGDIRLSGGEKLDIKGGKVTIK